MTSFQDESRLSPSLLSSSSSIGEEQRQRQQQHGGGGGEKRQQYSTSGDVDEEAGSSSGDETAFAPEEKSHTIKYKTCSWQKTAALLFSEYICLAILSFPWSYSVLGLVPGLILTVGIALIVLYTGLIIADYCVRHPNMRDVTDIGETIFWGSKICGTISAIMFIINNIFIMALHVLVGSRYLSTISNSARCPVDFAVVAACICFLFSLPRTLSEMSWLATFSAIATFISVLLTMIFAGVESHPNGFDPAFPVKWNLWPESGTTYVSGMSAMLNIVYTFVGQITYPSFIAEMKDPREFKKALYAVTICEIILFALAGSIVYIYIGNYYMTAPAFGSLKEPFLKIAFSFMIPTLVFLGVLYASVTCRFLFFRIFDNSHHKHEHTVLGWVVWAAILAVIWAIAFVIAEVIPFFSDLLSLMSSLFDCWFGFVFWGVAYIQMKKADLGGGKGWWKRLSWYQQGLLAVNIIIIGMGFYIMGPGLYASVESIILSYQAGTVGGVFSCVSNAM